MCSIKSSDFTGHNIYVGMDVHKKNWSVTIMFNGYEHKTFSQPPDAVVLMNYLHRNFPNGSYHCVYEAGFSGFYIQRELHSMGANCKVVNAADIPTTDKEKKHKDDKSDSRKLARCLSNQELSAIFVPNRQQEEERNLIRGRHFLVRDITRVKNRIKHTLIRYGISHPQKNEGWNKAYISWLNSIELETISGTTHLKLLISQFEELSNRQKEFNRSIVQLSQLEHLQRQVKYLRSLPGIGMVTCMTFLTEVTDIRRFSCLDTLCSFVGIVPNTYSSGEKERVGRMTKRGNSFLRHVLIEAAWRAIREDPELALAYKNYTTRMKGNKAIIRIARKLLSRMMYVLKNEKEYEVTIA